MTEEEVNSPVYYDRENICRIYAQEVAARDNVAVRDVDTEKEFEWCNIPCQVQRGLTKAFGELENVDKLVSSEPNDGSRSSEIYGN